MLAGNAARVRVGLSFLRLSCNDELLVREGICWKKRSVPRSAWRGVRYEYSCHEGNYAMEGVQSAASAKERGDAATKGSLR